MRGREKGIIVCGAMRLDLGFGKVQRQKGGMLTQDQNSHVDLITYERKRERERERERYTQTDREIFFWGEGEGREKKRVVRVREVV